MGNAQTRLSANTAIDYEEDQDHIELINFSITEAPDEEMNNTSKSNMTSSQRLRLFSTFQSAGSRSNSPMDDPNRLKLSDILSGGMALALCPGELNADSIFLRRMSHYEFVAHSSKGLKDLRILLCKELDDSLFSETILGAAIPEKIMMKPSLMVMPLGDFEKQSEPYNRKVAVYIPEDQQHSRRLYVFFVSGYNNQLLLKARAIMMNNTDKEHVEYIDNHLAEREEKLQKVVKSLLQSRDTLPLYDLKDVTEFVSMTRMVPKPPIRFLLGAKNTLLAYRIFEPLNREAIAANLLFVTTDSTYLVYLASAMAASHPIRVILAELRGFGYSGGRRGDAPSVSQIFSDIGQFVRNIRGMSLKPIILGGFFFTGGVVVNYAQLNDKEPVDAYVLLSPFNGRRWWSTRRVETWKNLQSQNLVRRNSVGFIMAKLTGGMIGGRNYIIKFKTSDDMYQFSPMHVSRITGNYIMSCQVKGRSSPFKKITKPLAFFIGENDEYFDAEKVEKIVKPSLRNEESRFFKVANANFFSILTEAPNAIAAWAVELEIVKPWKTKVHRIKHHFLTQEDLKCVERLLSKEIVISVQKGITNQVYDRAPRHTENIDGKLVSYDSYEPLYLPGRPVSCLLFIAPRFMAYAMPRMAEKYRVQIVRIDPWAVEGNKCYMDKRRVFRNIQSFLKIIKANYPAAPILLGGLGLGASLVVEYSDKKKHELVNGYVLLEPLADPECQGNMYICKNYMRQKIGDPVYLACAVEAKDCSEKEATILTKIGFNLGWKISTGPTLPRNLVEKIQSLDQPVTVFLPEKHLLMEFKTLRSQLVAFLRTTFKCVVGTEGNYHQIFDEAVDSIGDWIYQVSSSVAPPTPLRLKDPKIADFEPIEMIGKGTFGKVWLVRHTLSHRFLALKVLDKTQIIEKKQEDQVVRERDLLEECITCPFIVSFVGSFQGRKNLYILMEFVIGGELFTRMSNVGKFTSEAARFYIVEVVIALHFLHERQIVYRDLKPENIVLDALGHIRLVDFGFARRLDDQGRCGSFCGSPYYIAPEMLSGSRYGSSVDFWALGVLIFELLTGNPPFPGRTANEVYRNILFTNLQVPATIDPEASDLIKALLDPSPDKRMGHKNGLSDVMRHRWFKGIDWDRARAKQLPPPFQPQFTFEGDTTNFVKFSSSGIDLDDIEDGADDAFRGF